MREVDEKEGKRMLVVLIIKPKQIQGQEREVKGVVARLPSWRVVSWKPESVLLGRPVANALLLVLVLLLVLPIMGPPDLLSYRGCSSWPGSFESREPKEGIMLFH